MKLEKRKILIVIPAYNEQDCILDTCKKIENYNKKAKQKLDVVVINDGSKDNTEKILCENNLNHIKLIENLGIGGSVQTGYKYALENGYDIAIQYDGDGQHDVNYVGKIIQPILDNEAQMTVGSRFINDKVSEFKSSAMRRFGIKIISACIKLKTGNKIYDATSGFRAVNKDIIQKFSICYPREYPEPISTVEVMRDGYKVKEVPVSMNERTTGTSSISSWKNAYYMINVVLSILLMRRGK